MLGIVRAGCGLRVILHRDDRECLMTHAFDAIVVEIDVRDFDFGRQAVSLDRESRMLAENAMRFSVASSLAQAELHSIRNAIQEGTSG